MNILKKKIYPIIREKEQINMITIIKIKKIIKIQIWKIHMIKKKILIKKKKIIIIISKQNII